MLQTLSIVPLILSRAASAISPYFNVNDSIYRDFGALILKPRRGKQWINVQKVFDL